MDEDVWYREGLCAVRLTSYPALLGAARRILAESSPMYAWLEDAVPKQWHEEAAERLADFRLPLVLPYLRVVVRSADASSVTAIMLDHLVCHMESAQAVFLQGHARDQPLRMGSVEAVAIFAVIPPSPSTVLEHRTHHPLLRLWAFLTAALSTLLNRLTFLLPTMRWGALVPLYMYMWVRELHTAGASGDKSPLHDHGHASLQALCVAKGLQGQGLGTRVLRMVQAQASQGETFRGLRGLCHSESTRDFYVKQGFSAETVHRSPNYQDRHLVRCHHMVVWKPKKL